MQNWARWKPGNSTELIGEDIALVYEEISQEIEDGQGERCFLIYGKEGRGKTTIAEFIAEEFATHEINRRVLSGTQVTMSVVDEWKMDTMYVQSDNVVIVVNEVDRVHKNVQDHMHDWLQKLPRNWVFIVTTNHQPCVRAEYEKLTVEQRAEHLTPKFSSRFMQYEAPDINRKELAKVVYNRCMTPIEDKDERAKVVMACVDKGKGDIRQTLKQVQSALNKYKIKKRKELL